MWIKYRKTWTYGFDAWQWKYLGRFTEAEANDFVEQTELIEGLGREYHFTEKFTGIEHSLMPDNLVPKEAIEKAIDELESAIKYKQVIIEELKLLR